MQPQGVPVSVPAVVPPQPVGAAPFMRDIAETERFLDEVAQDSVLGPSIYTAYECGYCGHVKLTTAAGTGQSRAATTL